MFCSSATSSTWSSTPRCGGHKEYLATTVNTFTVVWVVFWPLNRFANFFLGPSNGFWAEMDHRGHRVSGFQGAIRLKGSTLLGVTPDIVLVRGVARTYQNIRLFNNMTVLENVLVGQHAAPEVESPWHDPAHAQRQP